MSNMYETFKKAEFDYNAGKYKTIKETTDAFGISTATYYSYKKIYAEFKSKEGSAPATAVTSEDLEAKCDRLDKENKKIKQILMMLLNP